MMAQKAIKVGMVQIGDKFGTQYYLPYSIGLLQAYAQKNITNADNFAFLNPLYKPIQIKKAVNMLGEANIVFFSIYVWNSAISVKIAESLKLTNKEVIIVFGGPQVPESRQGIYEFLKKYPFIDIACYGGGEATVTQILEHYNERNWNDVPSIAFINHKNKFIYKSASATLIDLKDIPSPYLDGVFNSLMKRNPRERWSALIETNRGCPFACAFCYWGKKTTTNKAKMMLHDQKRVFNEIDWMSQQKIEFVFCCDSNFGLLERDINFVRKVSENKKKYGFPMSFSIQNTKNSSERVFRLQRILNNSGLQKGVNLAFQSLNDATLRSINRSNIDNNIYKNLQQRFTQDGIPTFSDIIIGLPDESYDTFTCGVNSLISNGQHNRIQFIDLVVLENTIMSEIDYQRRYGFNIVESIVTPHHTAVKTIQETIEVQNLVVGTNALPKEDWVKTKVFCWMTSLLYFDKLLHIPFTIINKVCGISYKKLVEVFIESRSNHRKFSELVEFLEKKALEIQHGGNEYVSSRKWLNIWWPADEYLFIKLCAENELSVFYKEAESVLSELLTRDNFSPELELVRDSLTLNKHLIKLPWINSNLQITSNYNVYEMYIGILRARSVPKRKNNYVYLIDRTTERWENLNTWLKEVVWYGSKRGAYLYDIRTRASH